MILRKFIIWKLILISRGETYPGDVDAIAIFEEYGKVVMTGPLIVISSLSASGTCLL